MIIVLITLNFIDSQSFMFNSFMLRRFKNKRLHLHFLLIHNTEDIFHYLTSLLYFTLERNLKKENKQYNFLESTIGYQWLKVNIHVLYFSVILNVQNILCC